jgi:hypothetical protein
VKRYGGAEDDGNSASTTFVDVVNMGKIQGNYGELGELS